MIVVTGAGGFLGSRVVPMVRRHAPAARIIAVLRRRGQHAAPSGVEVVVGDLRAAPVWRRLPPTVTHVIHLAAVLPWDRGARDQARVIIDNVAQIAQLLQASTRWVHLRHVVYASSVSVYAPSRRPVRESSATAAGSAYAAAKLAGEHLLALLAPRRVRVASLRFSSIYGDGQYPHTVLPHFADRARRGLPLHVFNGRRMQDFVHVDDAARAAWLACRRSASGAFNVGSGQPVSMTRLAHHVVEACGRSPKSPIVDVARTGGADEGIRLDIGRARRLLQFSPCVDLRDGLKPLTRPSR
ncbi:MAG TPA: NAD(P)-dependent oxidoreductase [Vicinamibacterales bacterium]|nr:NAD(P)-dependent oxidoreductase [Vicinamibacterales bacterium]